MRDYIIFILLKLNYRDNNNSTEGKVFDLQKVDLHSIPGNPYGPTPSQE